MLAPFFAAASNATRPDALASQWLLELESRGARGLALRVGEHEWVVGARVGASHPLGALTVRGPLKMSAAERAVLGDLANLMSVWLHRFERFSATSRRAQTERVALRADLAAVVPDGTLVGTSPAMRRVRDLIAVVAPHDTTVAISGESGTGKELVARALHRLSKREGPFVAINCGALPPTLLEAELFGHVKGAFTGADRARMGLLRAAGEGTVFLDEVAELSLDAQARLLRVLQEHRVRAVGAEVDEPFAARVVSATHRDLRARVESGSFREDLFYRLTPFPIHVPPLRDRRQDIPALVEVTLRRLAATQRRSVPTISPEVALALRQHLWRGNVRELQNELERAMLMSGDELRWSAAASSATAETFDEIVRQALVDALTRTEGRIYGSRGAARLLDLPPSTLQTKMKKHGLTREDFER